MSVESAEMTKHAVNAFLATSVTFINEIAAICERVGADASDVERGLKSESRIGPKAYLSPGGAFAGGTLARDLMFLSDLGHARGIPTHVLAAVKTSNDAHRHWAERRLADMLGDMVGTTVAIWGLTYKPGTDTLRRSAAVELAQSLRRQGARVQAHDPAVERLPRDIGEAVRLCADPLSAASGAAALVVATPWPEFQRVPSDDVAARMSGNLVLDANRFLAETLGRQPRLRYVSVGRAA
jgi:UDPglucose 6-dehydrogenase